jgi:predicted small integral membrane protein
MTITINVQIRILLMFKCKNIVCYYMFFSVEIHKCMCTLHHLKCWEIHTPSQRNLVLFPIVVYHYGDSISILLVSSKYIHLNRVATRRKEKLVSIEEIAIAISLDKQKAIRQCSFLFSRKPKRRQKRDTFDMFYTYDTYVRYVTVHSCKTKKISLLFINCSTYNVSIGPILSVSLE